MSTGTTGGPAAHTTQPGEDWAGREPGHLPGAAQRERNFPPPPGPGGLKAQGCSYIVLSNLLLAGREEFHQLPLAFGGVQCCQCTK